MDLLVVLKKMVDSIIINNQAFYDIDDEIEWEFSKDNSNNPVAYEKDYKIMVNSNAVKNLMQKGELDKIEYYLLVAVRQLFQRLEIEGLEFEMETITDPKVIKIWKDEEVITNEEDKDFFNSVRNIDAYAYAYGVMKYKYDNVDCLDVPSVNKDKFLELVDAWVKKFNE